MFGLVKKSTLEKERVQNRKLIRVLSHSENKLESLKSKVTGLEKDKKSSYELILKLTNEINILKAEKIGVKQSIAINKATLLKQVKQQLMQEINNK